MIAIVGASASSVLTAVGAFLVVDDPLQPAMAIVVLDGGVPFREQEAAQLYAQGWAPRVVITEGTGAPDGSGSRTEWLERLGVPADAISVVGESPSNTLDELEVLASAIQPNAPILLVTSPYHTRRTAIAWSRATGGRAPGLLRSAWQDTFDIHTWWREPKMRSKVWHEYVGLAAYWLGLRGA